VPLNKLMPWIEAVNRFWFVELDPDEWFSAKPEVDEKIRSRFGDLRAALKGEPPEAEALDAQGHVAAVIVFDQFSRNLFRRSPEAYATDDLALALALHAIENRLDASLTPHQRQFLYMPFMHSEDRGMQARSVGLFGKLGLGDQMGYAAHHKAIVDRFGRFPHRNEVLGRSSTAEESAFLSNEPNSGG
jgi:uncharacterized protein (DUF924 family)